MIKDIEIGIIAVCSVTLLLVIVILFLLVRHINKDKKVQNIHHEHYIPYVKEVPVPKYVQADRSLPETVQPKRMYGDQVMRVR